MIVNKVRPLRRRAHYVVDIDRTAVFDNGPGGIASQHDRLRQPDIDRDPGPLVDPAIGPREAPGDRSTVAEGGFAIGEARVGFDEQIVGGAVVQRFRLSGHEPAPASMANTARWYSSASHVSARCR